MATEEACRQHGGPVAHSNLRAGNRSVHLSVRQEEEEEEEFDINTFFEILVQYESTQNAA